MIMFSHQSKKFPPHEQFEFCQADVKRLLYGRREHTIQEMTGIYFDRVDSLGHSSPNSGMIGRSSRRSPSRVDNAMLLP